MTDQINDPTQIKFGKPLTSGFIFIVVIITLQKHKYSNKNIYWSMALIIGKPISEWVMTHENHIL